MTRTLVNRVGLRLRGCAVARQGVLRLRLSFVVSRERADAVLADRSVQCGGRDDCEDEGFSEGC